MKQRTKSMIAILGAGSWGTAVAIHIAQSGHHVMLWGRNPQHVAEMREARCNIRYLPNNPFPEHLTVTDNINDCIDKATQMIIAVPSHAFVDILNIIPKPQHGLSWLTKGLDPQSHDLLSKLVAQKLGESFPIAIISGPSFAREVAQGLPTALVLASNNPSYSQTIHALLHQRSCRVYDSNDLIGIQWCGAIKNVIAIACGVSDGLNYGANARAALITRGLAEMRRIGTHFGGRQETFMGLAGVGDLVLTCTDDQSRNRRFGLHIGRGIACVDAEKQIGQVVEGKHNAIQIDALAQKYKIDMPICHQIHVLLEGKTTPKEAFTYLMSRPAREE